MAAVLSAADPFVFVARSQLIDPESVYNSWKSGKKRGSVYLTTTIDGNALAIAIAQGSAKDDPWTYMEGVSLNAEQLAKLNAFQVTDTEFQISGGRLLVASINALGLGGAHTIRSSGQNVSFENKVDSTVYHPVWQTTSNDSGDSWAAYKRHPVSAMLPLQAADAPAPGSAVTVTDGQVQWTPANNIRVYGFGTFADGAQTISVTIEERVGNEWVEFWHLDDLNVSAGYAITYFDDFVDLRANKLIRISVTGSIRGEGTKPYLDAYFRRWEDREVATILDTNNVLESSNGTQYQLVVANDGTLSTQLYTG